jgi:nucleotide-binding universal stress UspA family protein
MKKFLVVFDGYKMSESSMNYAIQLTQFENAHLVGVFLDEIIYHTYSVYKVMTSTSDYQKKLEELDEKDQKKRDDAVLSFRKACELAKINFSIHRDTNIAFPELKHESIFADLVIINEYETFSRIKESLPTSFIKDLLGDVQCPVLVTPAAFKKIDRIVLLYDGKPYALHAVKMFSYVLGCMRRLPVEIITVKDEKKVGRHLPDKRLMKEFIKRHFENVKYTVLKGTPEQQIVEYLRSSAQNVLVVLGAYQRSDISRWFKVSMADVLMEALEMPLFIGQHQ